MSLDAIALLGLLPEVQKRKRCSRSPEENLRRKALKKKRKAAKKRRKASRK